jgi:hypothetical protein
MCACVCCRLDSLEEHCVQEAFDEAQAPHEEPVPPEQEALALVLEDEALALLNTPPNTSGKVLRCHTPMIVYEAATGEALTHSIARVHCLAQSGTHPHIE